MNNISFGQYVPGNSWIYKLDPRSKMLFTIALIVLIFLIPDFYAMVVALGVVLLILLSTGIPFLKVLKGLKGIMFLMIFTAIIQLAYTTSTEELPLYSFEMSLGLFQILIILGLLILYIFTKKYVKLSAIYFLVILFLAFCFLWDNPFEKFSWNFNLSFARWDFNVYKVGLNKVGFIVIRIVLMILITSLLTLSTMPTDINNALEWLLHPLTYIKIPVGVISTLLSLTLRFIPTLMQEANKIMNAQASRGVDFKSANLGRKVAQITSLLIPMLVISFKRAEDLALAMEARGYVVGAKRTKVDLLKFKWGDLVALVVVAGMFASVILRMVGVY